jgi:hypothetical protein
MSKSQQPIVNHLQSDLISNPGALQRHNLMGPVVVSTCAYKAKRDLETIPSCATTSYFATRAQHGILNH